jgi:fermentation-respiration switch protein FrsA (DUF1100 family)
VPPDARFGLREERVETRTADGTRLVGWAMRTRVPDSTGFWLLIFHGNGGNISSDGREQHYARLQALGLDLLTFDYRGYGESDGDPSETGMYEDADATYAYLRNTLGVPAERIVIFGHSLGSTIAVDLASRVPVRGLILEGAPTSVPDAGQAIYPWLPRRWLARSRFASAEKIARVRSPVLFLHAVQDEVIPVRLGRRLYGLANEPKRFVELHGGHADAYLQDASTYDEAIRGFLGGLARSRP